MSINGGFKLGLGGFLRCSLFFAILELVLLSFFLQILLNIIDFFSLVEYQFLSLTGLYN